MIALNSFELTAWLLVKLFLGTALNKLHKNNDNNQALLFKNKSFI